MSADGAEFVRLRMRHDDLSQLAPSPLPAGYGLRAFAPGDETAWISLLNSGEFGLWDGERLARLLAGERAPLPPECVLFLLDSGGAIVGTACAFLHSPELCELGWVVISPEHRGRGLSAPLCAAALQAARALGCRQAFLKTESFRPAAIRVYETLGFTIETSA